MTCTTESRAREIHRRTRRYRARHEARQLACLTACSLLLLAGIGLPLRGGAGAYAVIGLAAFAAGVAVTVLCVRLKNRAAKRKDDEEKENRD